MWRKVDAYKVYLAHVSTVAFLHTLIFTVNMFYYVDMVKLNPFQLVLTGTALEISIFLFEIPTGIVADTYSRRLSIIIGVFLTGIAFLLNTIPAFAVIFFSQALWGFGHTFTSGATNAWITDEIGEERANRAFLRSAQFRNVAAGLAIPFSVALASLELRLPIFMGGIGFLLLTLALLVFMREEGFHPTPAAERNSWQDMRRTFRDGVTMVKKRPILVNILVMGLILGAFSEGYDRLWVAHLSKGIGLPKLGNFEPVVWLGILGICGMIFSIAATELARRRVDVNNQGAIIRALQAVSGLLILSLGVFALTQQFALAVLAIWLISIARHVIDPLYAAWINQGLDSKVRATIFSMAGQADAIGQLAGGPVMGLVGNAWGIRAALMGSAGLLVPILWLFRSTLRQHENGITAEIEATALGSDLTP